MWGDSCVRLLSVCMTYTRVCVCSIISMMCMCVCACMRCVLV